MSKSEKQQIELDMGIRFPYGDETVRKKDWKSRNKAE
ncbi:hypothetical protein P872_18850 [Rhodonellum psychrophilum GCM71 = DSM 17998]|uniref:Uncharacterized protein n=1 Tax=Rhodonellum psychrophilum GCM71 = DSM 17998 TaxID=1123057 RepID=U5BWJ1_9BACT|nr:hypothetical protein P872_18850 [Rhodonellum psychrophilum GCM71 = DSM 17998]